MKNVISDNRFLRVLIAAQRARQIHKGAHPLVRSSKERATRIALEEIERGLISFEFNSQSPDLNSKSDNRDFSENDVEGGINRELTNQLSVSKLLSVE